MKKLHRIVALLLAALMAFGLLTTAFAATDSAPIIYPGKKASLSIYKYDITKAGTEGAWDAESYVSTGLHDDAVVDKLAKYAIQGVEFTYLRVANIAMSNEVVDGQRQVGVLYGSDSSERSNAVLSAIGLTAADAHKTEGGINYFTSDMLNNKLSAALAANATIVKNALEVAVKNGGVAMAETDATGHTSADQLEQGLYLVVETRVPENVTSTCNPFFVSLPMTTTDGAAWNYDVTVYPKNQTGNPTLDKTVREAKNSTGKNTGSLTDITDGYAHTATASVGDTVDYQIISTLSTITSKASSLSEYTYVDTLSKGIRYNKNDVVIEFFKDAGCADKITTWDENSGKFAVAYDDAANTMTIRMTESGLAEINEAAIVYTDSVKRGYSDCTMRITYAATLTADAQMGDTDNPNEVVLTWKRTNTTYFDTLKDCCHVYTYGIDVLKQFSDNGGNVRNVKFRLHNDIDDCYIIAEQKDGVYYAKGFAAKKADATTFVPNSSGHIVVKGLEDDTYSLTETATDKGYVLLKDAVKIVIKTAENGQCEKCGTKLLTASATVNGKDVTMSDGNAIVPLTVVNNPGFDLPKTGGYGTWMFTIGGVALLGAAAFIVIRSRKQHKNEQ
jgi:fimbrial isopeptide formation D2 family protein/LPXTG-motif cell wall-anchored protein